MRHVIRLTALILLLASGAPVQASEVTTPDHVVISEVQVTAGTGRASEEFVELYNPTDEPIELTDWKLQYGSAASDTANSDLCKENWSTKLAFDDTDKTIRNVIEPRGFLLLVTDKYLEAITDENEDFDHDAIFSSGLASDGHIRLVKSESDPDNTEESLETAVDLVGWGAAQCAEGFSPADAPAESESIKRIFDSDGQVQDTNINSDDFGKSGIPNPQSTPPPNDDTSEEPDGDAPEDEPEEEPEEPEPAPEDPVYLKLDITEVLPDPDKPQMDKDDEFVELFNPNAQAVNLKGYALKTGSSLQTIHTFENTTIAPGNYRAFYSNSANIGLVNSGGKAQLLDPTGKIVSQLVSYPEETGESWARLGGQWLWTDRVTPGAVNQTRAQSAAETPAANQATTSQTRVGPFAKVAITELLPDPASPATDADDEYVELFNPNSFPVDLTDYAVETGTDFKTKHTLKNLKIEPRQYIALFSSAAKLSLTNKGGAARLLDPAGQVIATTDPYPKAKTGAAWAFAGGKWQWTSTPTPAASNELTQVKTASAKKTTGTNRQRQNSARTALAAPATIGPSPTSNLLVAGAVGSALLYGLYEWRGDLRNFIQRLRRYRRAG